MMITNMWWSVGLWVISLALVSLTHYWYRWSNPKCNGELPPGSMGFPLIGETIQYFIGGDMHSVDIPPFIKKRIARYGTIFRTSLLGRPVVMSSDPEFSNFIFQQENKLVEQWFTDSFSTIIGTGVNMTNSGQILKYIKTSYLNHFGIERLKAKLMNDMEVTANQHLQSWSTQSSVHVKESIASDRGKLLNTLKVIINDRLTSPEKRQGDLLDQLLNDRDKEGSLKEEWMTEEFLESMMFGFLLASVEPISLTLNAAMLLLSDHPLVLKELIDEHDEIIRNRKNVESSTSWIEYKSMTFTSKVINETLRLSSVAPGILRKVIKDIHVNGYVIPKGWTIMILHSAIHKNPEKFEDPLAFNPWRWKDSGSNTRAKNFYPFGGGTRYCIGAEFSKVFMSIFLHVSITKFSWTKVKGGGNATGSFAASPRNDFHVKISGKTVTK